MPPAVNYCSHILSGRERICAGFQVLFLHMCTEPVSLWLSLTQEASLKEVDNLRKQIYQIKGGEAVGTQYSLPTAWLTCGSSGHSYCRCRHQARPRQRTRSA